VPGRSVWSPSACPARRIRRRVFGAFEMAESTTDPAERSRWLTFVLVGGRDQLDDVIAVLEAEQGRKSRGAVLRRPAWKDLVFTGDAGSGKSRAAVAIGQAYRKLGVLASN